MSFVERINTDIKEAMKAKDKDRLTTLRAVKSAILLASTEKGAEGVSDEDVLKILQKLLKQRKESVEIYKGQNRDDLVAEELAQAKVLEQYLPAQMDPEEIKKGLALIIEETGASAISDIGKIMGPAMQKFAGKADGKLISALAKELLS